MVQRFEQSFENHTSIFNTQNKLKRFVLDLESRSHISKEHFELLNWLPVNSRVHHVFKMKNSLSPQYIRLREHFIPKMVFIPITLVRLCDRTEIRSKRTPVVPRAAEANVRHIIAYGISCSGQGWRISD